MSIIYITDYKVRINSNTLLGNLNDIWLHGNRKRHRFKWQTKNISEYIDTVGFNEYTESIKKYLGEDINVLQIRRGGQHDGTPWAHIGILPDAVAYIDPLAKLEIYKKLFCYFTK